MTPTSLLTNPRIYHEVPELQGLPQEVQEALIAEAAYGEEIMRDITTGRDTQYDYTAETVAADPNTLKTKKGQYDINNRDFASFNHKAFGSGVAVKGERGEHDLIKHGSGYRIDDAGQFYVNGITGEKERRDIVRDHGYVVDQLEAAGYEIPTTTHQRGKKKTDYKDVDLVVNQMSLREKTEVLPKFWGPEYKTFLNAVDEAHKVAAGGGGGSPSAFGPTTNPEDARPQGQIQTTPTARPVGFDEDPNNPGQFIRR
jgi:hypothetical protein